MHTTIAGFRFAKARPVAARKATKVSRLLLTVLVLLTVVARKAVSQDRNPFAGGQNITVQGVYIDAKHVLRYRQPAKGVAGQFRRDKKLGKSFVTISLPKLFAEVRRFHASGKPLPEKLRHLDGLVKLKYVVVDPDTKDLLIAGPSEPVDATNPVRPRGRKTGRPVLQLDDLIVALRTVGPGRRATAFGCSLVHDPKAAERVAALQRAVRKIRPGAQRRVQSALKEAIGPLNAKFFGVPPDSRFAFVCVESDYRMKRISLGLERPVRGLRSYAAMTSGGNLFNRFWFTANYPPLPVSKDGRIIGIPDRGLKLLASSSPTKVTKTNSAATTFAATFTKKLPELEAVIPGFADLQNLADLAVLAALIDADRLHENVGWDLSWLLKTDGYKVAEFPTPRQAETLVNVTARGRRIVTVAGGVQLAVRPFVKRRKMSEKMPAAELSRGIVKGEWSRMAKSR